MCDDDACVPHTRRHWKLGFADCGIVLVLAFLVVLVVVLVVAVSVWLLNFCLVLIVVVVAAAVVVLILRPIMGGLISTFVPVCEHDRL